MQLILLRMEGRGSLGEWLSVEAPAGTSPLVVRQSHNSGSRGLLWKGVRILLYRQGCRSLEESRHLLVSYTFSSSLKNSCKSLVPGFVNVETSWSLVPRLAWYNTCYIDVSFFCWQGSKKLKFLLHCPHSSVQWMIREEYTFSGYTSEIIFSAFSSHL